MTASPYPDGIEDRHSAPLSGPRRWRSLLSLAVLGGLLALAMTGLLAGGRTRPQTIAAPEATMTASVPRSLRNGEFFEMRLEVTARRDIADATIAVPPTLWRDMTINSVVPAPGEEAFEDAAFAFHFGALKAGDTLEVKIDGQINPPLTFGTRGAITLRDDRRPVAALPVRIRVLP